MPALLLSALLLGTWAGPAHPSDTEAGPTAHIAATGDCAASIAPASQGRSLPVAAPALALPREQASIFGSSCDGEDDASDRGALSPATGWSPHRTAALRESSRSAARWRHRGRGPPLRA